MFTQLERYERKKYNTVKKFDNIVSVRFFLTKRRRTYFTYINMGKDICEKIGLKGGDRLSFFYGTDNPRIWLIKKAIETDKKSYKTHIQKWGEKTTGRSLRFWISLPYEPQEFEKEIHHVRYDFYEGGLRIFSEEKFDEDEDL